VTHLELQDGGSSSEMRACGQFPQFGDPQPATYAHTFSGVPPSSLYYFDPSACRTSKAPIGTIVIDR